MQIKVKATPRAKQNKILGWRGDVLRIHIAVPPVDNKANAALADFLAEEWQINRANIKIIQGRTSRNKILEVPDNTSLPLQNTLI